MPNLAQAKTLLIKGSLFLQGYLLPPKMFFNRDSEDYKAAEAYLQYLEDNTNKGTGTNAAAVLQEEVQALTEAGEPLTPLIKYKRTAVQVAYATLLEVESVSEELNSDYMATSEYWGEASKAITRLQLVASIAADFAVNLPGLEIFKDEAYQEVAGEIVLAAFFLVQAAAEEASTLMVAVSSGGVPKAEQARFCQVMEVLSQPKVKLHMRLPDLVRAFEEVLEGEYRNSAQEEDLKDPVSLDDDLRAVMESRESVTLH